MTILAAALPDDVLALSTATSSTLPAPTAIRTRATAIQYDELRIEHDEGEVEIVVYNRAILLFMTGRPGPAWCSGSPCPARVSDVVGNCPVRRRPTATRRSSNGGEARLSALAALPGQTSLP